MSKKEDSIFKRKGFYVALYACLGVVMVTTAVVSFNNIAQQQADDMAYVDEDMLQVDLGQTPPIADYIYHDLDAELALRRNQQQEGAPEPAPSPSPSPSPQAQYPEPELEAEAGEPEDYYSAAIVEDEVEEGAADEPLAFAYFDNTQSMQWPVFGEVVMDFSVDSLIYDRTLDQFRTNDQISISAELGSQVLSAAGGIVERIGNNREHGNYVVVNHGNGWLTTYSQLQDGVLVSIGDVVAAGQPIGGVGSPSVFSVLLGNHLGFRVESNGEVVNPRTLLEY